MRIVAPTSTSAQATTSSTTRVVPSSASTMTAVYVPAVATRIIVWSTRRSIRRSRCHSRRRWYVPLTASIEVTEAPYTRTAARAPAVSVRTTRISVSTIATGTAARWVDPRSTGRITAGASAIADVAAGGDGPVL